MTRLNDNLQKAVQLMNNQEFLEAEKIYNHILSIKKDEPTATHMLAMCLHRRDANDEAVPLMERSTELDPQNWVFRYNLACAYRTVNRQYDAINSFEMLSMLPLQTDIDVEIGICYQEKRDFVNSEKYLRASIEKRFWEPYAYYNLGLNYMEQLRYEEAVECFRQALKINSKFTPAAWNLSTNLLTLGRLEEGFERYEARWDQFKGYRERRKISKQIPLWNGTDSIEGKRILICSEQGLGDIINFSRYAKFIQEKGGHIIFACPNPEVVGDLVPIFKNMEFINETITEKDELNVNADYVQFITSLPHVFKTSLDTIPWFGPYVKETPCFDQKWEEDWAKYKDVLKIGICWSGNPKNGNDFNRSCHLKHFKHLVSDKVQLFALQKDSEERSWPKVGKVDLMEGSEGIPIINLSNDMKDFNYTANILKKLDLVITVDTALAHLAGAMGLSVWMAIPHIPDWRWLLDRNDSPWYPSMRIFRQKEPGDWDTVFREIGKELYDRHSV